MGNLIQKVIVGLVGLTLAGSISLSNPIITKNYEPNALTYYQNTDSEVRSLQIALVGGVLVGDGLDTWLDELRNYENCPVEGIVDINRNLSFGCLCFQENTFKGYVKQFNLLPQSEDVELMNWISDCDFQKILAKKMIQDKYENWSHWRTSVIERKLGLPPK